MTNRKILAAWLLFAALNAALFGCYVRIRDNHAKVDVVAAEHERDSASVDASANEVVRSQRSLDRIDKNIARIRNFIATREQRYPNGAPPGMVKLYAEMAEDEKVSLATRALREKEHQALVAAHAAKLAARERRTQEVEALRRKAWNPFWFP